MSKTEVKVVHAKWTYEEIRHLTDRTPIGSGFVDPNPIAASLKASFGTDHSAGDVMIALSDLIKLMNTCRMGNVLMTREMMVEALNK